MMMASKPHEQKIQAAKDAIAPPPSEPSALSDDHDLENCDHDGWVYAHLVTRIAGVCGKPDAEVAEAILRCVVPAVIEYRQRCLEAEKAVHRTMIACLDGEKSWGSVHIPTESPLGVALWNLADVLCNDTDVESALPPLFLAVRQENDPGASAKRLAHSVLRALEKGDSSPRGRNQPDDAS